MKRSSLIFPALTGLLLIVLGIVIGSGDCLYGEDMHGMTSDSLGGDRFELAVEIIKKYEGLHQPRHYPLVGYGHKILPGERFPRSKALSQKEAEALLRKDLLKNCAVFREYGADSLLLGVLAYNIGSGNVKRSQVTVMLRNGNRNIRDHYLRHCRYRGKVLNQLQRRRVEEFESLYVTSDSIKFQTSDDNKLP